MLQFISYLFHHTNVFKYAFNQQSKSIIFVTLVILHVLLAQDCYNLSAYHAYKLKNLEMDIVYIAYGIKFCWNA